MTYVKHWQRMLWAALAFTLVLAWAMVNPCRAAQQAQLDFAVQGIQLGAGCKVEVRVIRRGPGKLPRAKMAGVVLLRIKVGKKHYDYDFKTVDPAGKLLAGPGVVVFRSPLVVRKPVMVTAMVDPQNRLREAKEGRANLATLKASTNSCGGGQNQDKALMHTLKIVGAYSQGRSLYVVIAHKPKAGIPRSAYDAVALRVESGRARRQWPLGKAMAAAKRTKDGLHFNTKLMVKPGSQVAVGLKKGKYAKRRVFTLAAEPRKKGGGIRKGGGVAKGESHGLMVFKPTSAKIGRRGGAMAVLYGVDRDVPAGPVRVTLMRGPMEFGSMTGSYIPTTGSRPNEHMVNFVIPNNVAYGPGYYFKVSMPGNRWGNSDEFRIEPFGDNSTAGRPTFEIKVVAPSGQATALQQGTTTMLSWRLLGDYYGTPSFLVSLWKGGRKVLDIDASSAVWHANSRTYTLDWQVPSDLAYGSDYRLKVADRHSSGEDVSDEYFRVIGPIKVFVPSEVYLSNPMTIRWEVLPHLATSYVKIFLINTRGDIQFEIWSRPAHTGTCEWPVGANARTGDGWVYHPDNGELMRGPWKIRVQKSDDPEVYGDSGEFYVNDPRMTVTTTGIRHGIRINWSSSQLNSEARVNIRVTYYDSVLMGNQTLLIFQDKPVNGSVEWDFRDTHFPNPRALPTQAHIVITVRNFYRAGVGGSSPAFTLSED